MALPSIMRKLFRNDGYGPLLKPEIIPFATNFSSDAPDEAASTEWIKDLLAEPVYVDSVNGNDNNDGFSQATPKQTINAALSIPGRHDIRIAAGTYTENVTLYHINTVFKLLGNVTLVGYLALYQSSSLFVYHDGSDHTQYRFTVNNIADIENSIAVDSNSSLLVYTDVIVTTTGSASQRTSVLAVNCSIIQITGTLSVTHNAPYAALFAWNKSNFYFMSDVVVTSSGTPIHSILIDQSSSAIFEGNFVSNSCNAKYGCSILSDSFVIFGKICDTKGSEEGLALRNNSGCLLYVDNYTTIKSNKLVLCVSDNSLANFIIASGKAAYLESIGSSATGVRCQYGGNVIFTGGGTLQFNGAFNQVVLSTTFGRVYIHAGLTLNGDATGQRYEIWNNAWVYVDGKGVNRIPGTTPGSVKSNELSFYG